MCRTNPQSANTMGLWRSIYRKDYKNKVRNLEKELQRIKENAPKEVVEAIVRRELIKTIAYFHIEMIFLTILALWPSLID